MDIPTSDMPHAVKILVLLAVVATSLSAIAAFAVKVLKISKKARAKAIAVVGLIERINAELSPNGGGSIKDSIKRLSSESKENLSLTNQIKNELQSEREQRHIEHKTISERLEDVKAESNARADAIERKLARYIIHEAKNDLHASNLLKEEERLLAEIGKRPENP